MVLQTIFQHQKPHSTIFAKIPRTKEVCTMPDSLLAPISSGLWLELLSCTVEYKYIPLLGASALDFGLHRAKRDIIITPTQTVTLLELLNCTGTKELTSAYMTNLRVLTSSKCRVLERHILGTREAVRHAVGLWTSGFPPAS
jgi:hypothetical protein